MDQLEGLPLTARDLFRRASRRLGFHLPVLVLAALFGLLGAALAMEQSSTRTLALTTSGYEGEAIVPAADAKLAQQATCELLDCCRPMVLKVEASAHSIEDPDPYNDPNDIDIAWRATGDEATVPIKFELVYCNYHSQGTTCHTYTGRVEIDPDDEPLIVFDSNPPDPGNCGSVLASPYPSASELIQFVPWMNDPHVNTSIALCGTDVYTDDFPGCLSFASTEYYFWIARTATTGVPQLPIQCFKSIKVWVDGTQSEDGTVLQHNYDSLDDCPESVSDEYIWVSSPQTTVTYAHFDAQECLEPDVNFPGGQEVQICIVANFEPN